MSSIDGLASRSPVVLAPGAGRTLQIACVYGDLTARLRSRLNPGGGLDIVDVLRVQLDNLGRKLPGDPRVGLILGDSAALELPAASYDRALIFFLLSSLLAWLGLAPYSA